jgi:hypothetical protein
MMTLLCIDYARLQYTKATNPYSQPQRHLECNLIVQPPEDVVPVDAYLLSMFPQPANAESMQLACCHNNLFSNNCSYLDDSSQAQKWRRASAYYHQYQW